MTYTMTSKTCNVCGKTFLGCETDGHCPDCHQWFRMEEFALSLAHEDLVRQATRRAQALYAFYNPEYHRLLDAAYGSTP